MRKSQNHIELYATDLSNQIACVHLTYLNLAVVNGKRNPPPSFDSNLKILQERGLEFEQSYLKLLKEEGLTIVEPATGAIAISMEKTIEAMQNGIEVIYQANLSNGIWRGRTDFLMKVDRQSQLGAWSYEIVDSKLAKETRTGTILQLCLYSDLIQKIQGTTPEFIHVITPADGFLKHSYRLDDFLAYYRSIKKQLESIVDPNSQFVSTYPIPCDHCGICNWWQVCDTQRRKDDHLSLVAGLSNSHIEELKKWQVLTLERLAELPLPIVIHPARGSKETYERLREQARVQLEARISGNSVYENLSAVEGLGLYRLPEPSEGDIFFDFEGDPFAGNSGLEYLFGWTDNNDSYNFLWALTREKESEAFEKFIDIMMARWHQFPDMHIYHFTPYEPSALKRLMGKYAKKEKEIDTMLRAKLFIDLHSITKQAIRAGVEVYSLKELEQFHHFKRKMALREAAKQLRAIEGFIERKTIGKIPEEICEAVRKYNEDDCVSTKSLYKWLESIRGDLMGKGFEISRPVLLNGEASESITEHQKRIAPLYEMLLKEVPLDPSERNFKQQAKFLLANMMDWYRREKKATSWEYFRLRDLSDEELVEEKAAITGLTFSGNRSNIKKSVIDRYNFTLQECDIREGDKLKSYDGDIFGEVVSINTISGSIEIKKGPKTKELHPTAVFRHIDISDKVKEEAIIRIATWVAENDIDAEGEYRAGRDLLMNNLPRTIENFVHHDLPPQQKAVKWVNILNNGVLPIQGPPGTGKSHTAAEMILSLIASGKKIGITALSHKVITGLMKKVIQVSEERGISVRCMRKVSELSINPDAQIFEEKDNDKVATAIRTGEVQVLGGTPWLWAREDMANSVDVLFVDEAGQLSLIDTVTVSQAASNLVLLGDPQQLKQPQQGSHPDGTEVSALEHILRGHKTIPDERGIFLDVTWRMHPKICSFISELFYESLLKPKPDLFNQKLEGDTLFKGSGLWYSSVIHTGNQSSSEEEVLVVAEIISNLLSNNVFFNDNKNQKKRVDDSDIKVIAPYNAQVSLLSKKLSSTIQVGTVDKFQGQEAPIIIFSMATSSPAEAPKGMEFLYSLNRLNVAVSRAKAIFILVSSPKLFDPDCKSIQQMRLANSFCRYLEMATIVI